MNLQRDIRVLARALRAAEEPGEIRGAASASRLLDQPIAGGPAAGRLPGPLA